LRRKSATPPLPLPIPSAPSFADHTARHAQRPAYKGLVSLCTKGFERARSPRAIVALERSSHGVSALAPQRAAPSPQVSGVRKNASDWRGGVGLEIQRQLALRRAEVERLFREKVRTSAEQQREYALVVTNDYQDTRILEKFSQQQREYALVVTNDYQDTRILGF